MGEALQLFGEIRMLLVQIKPLVESWFHEAVILNKWDKILLHMPLLQLFLKLPEPHIHDPFYVSYFSVIVSHFLILLFLNAKFVLKHPLVE